MDRVNLVSTSFLHLTPVRYRYICETLRLDHDKFQTVLVPNPFMTDTTSPEAEAAIQAVQQDLNSSDAINMSVILQTLM